MNISDSVFLITGGASGLGAATARMAVAEGGKVVLADVNRDDGQTLAAELGDRALFVFTDVTESELNNSAFPSVDGGIHAAIRCFSFSPPASHTSIRA